MLKLVHPLYSWSGNRWKRRYAWRRYRRKSFYINTDLTGPPASHRRSLTPFPIQCSRSEIDRGGKGVKQGGWAGLNHRAPAYSWALSARGSEPIYRLCSARMYAGTYACVYTRARVRAHARARVCMQVCRYTENG